VPSPRPGRAPPRGSRDRMPCRRSGQPANLRSVGGRGLTVPVGPALCDELRQLGDVRGECGRVGRVLNSGSRSPSS
jgi:hypothetical protein